VMDQFRIVRDMIKTYCEHFVNEHLKS